MYGKKQDCTRTIVHLHAMYCLMFLFLALLNCQQVEECVKLLLTSIIRFFFAHFSRSIYLYSELNGRFYCSFVMTSTQSQYNKLGSHVSPPSDREQIDLSWQLSLQRVWESLLHSNKGCSNFNCN